MKNQKRTEPDSIILHSQGFYLHFLSSMAALTTTKKIWQAANVIAYQHRHRTDKNLISHPHFPRRKIFFYENRRDEGGIIAFEINFLSESSHSSYSLCIQRFPVFAEVACRSLRIRSNRLLLPLPSAAHQVP